MRGGRRGGLLLGAITTALCLTVFFQDALALTDEETFRQFQFSFIKAGARALGMGGAYVALADDASAAEANPAGLRFVKDPQLYLEYGQINSDIHSSRSSQGTLGVNPVTGDRTLPFLSLESDLEADTSGVPAFVGYSRPFTLGSAKRRLVLAGSRQVIQSQDLSLPSSGSGPRARFSFDSFPNTVSGSQVVAYSVSAPVTGSMSSEIVYWNAAAAADLHPDFSVGATLSYASLNLDGATRTTVEDPLQILVDSSHPRLPAQPNTDVYRSEVNGTDSDVTFTVGIHWHPGTAFAAGRSPWQFGASYRRGANFGVEESTFLNGQPDRRLENRIAVPDQFTAGASYRLHERWLLSGEVDRVEFSVFSENYKAGVNYLTSPRLASGAFGARPTKAITFKLDDGNVYRLGMERTLPLAGREGPRLALRAGWFRTPDMQLRMTRFNSTDRQVNRTYRRAFPDGSPESHYTVGAGLEWGGSSFQAAFETSDFGKRLLATYVFNSGRRP